jgi:hypothetical protein
LGVFLKFGSDNLYAVFAGMLNFFARGKGTKRHRTILEFLRAEAYGVSGVLGVCLFELGSKFAARIVNNCL